MNTPQRASRVRDRHDEDAARRDPQWWTPAAAGRLRTLILALLILPLAACRTTGEATHAERYPLFAAMQAELTPLEMETISATFGADAPLAAAPVSPTPLIHAHYAETTQGVEGARHYVGTVPAIGLDVAVHLFVPAGTPRGTVVLVHGYLAHALQHAPMIQQLLRAHYLVVAPELPGHGLSGGARGNIDSFLDYGDFLRDVLATVTPTIPEPLHAVGHSTGATTIYEHLRRHGDPFETVVFVAPLVRSAWYTLARAGRTLSRPFLRAVGTGYNDPIGVSVMPLAWFDALVAWNRVNGSFATVDRTVLILQGTSDEVVDWRYNRAFLTNAFASVEYELFEDAGHVLFRERMPVREAAIARVIEWVSHSEEISRNF